VQIAQWILGKWDKRAARTAHFGRIESEEMGPRPTPCPCREVHIRQAFESWMAGTSPAMTRTIYRPPFSGI